MSLEAFEALNRRYEDAVEARENANAATLRAEAERDRYRQEAAEYRHIGDRMQSEAGRVAEWADEIWRQSKNLEMSYEVRTAIVGLNDAIAQWTDARIGYATENRP